jgi:3-dehydroquinate synthase
MESSINPWTSFWKQLPNTGFWLSLLVFTSLVIASFVLFELPIQHGITELVPSLSQQPTQRLSLSAVMILLLAFDVVLPVPSTLLALLATTFLGFIGGSLAIFIGLCSCALFGYLLGAGYFRLASQWLSDKDKQQGGELADKLGTLALVCLRGIPVLAEVSVLAAGMRRYPLRKFLLVTTLANAGLALAYGYIGSFLAGEEAFLLRILTSIFLPSLFLAFCSFLKRRIYANSFIDTHTEHGHSCMSD